MLLAIFASLTLLERLCAAAVCKNWRRILLAELRIPPEHIWRSPALARSAGAALQVLDLPGLCRSADRWKIAVDLCQALADGAGAQLVSLVLWEVSTFATETCDEDSIAYLSGEQALQIRAACPRLSSSTRLSFSVKTALQGLDLLEALPGRHALQLTLPPADKAFETPVAADAQDFAAFNRLLRHARLAALEIENDDEPADLEEARSIEACLLAVVASLEDAQQGQLGACTLEHLHVCDICGSFSRTAAFKSVESVVDAFNVPSRRDNTSLLSLRLAFGKTPNSFLQAILVATCGSLRHLALVPSTWSWTLTSPVTGCRLPQSYSCASACRWRPRGSTVKTACPAHITMAIRSRAWRRGSPPTTVASAASPSQTLTSISCTRLRRRQPGDCCPPMRALRRHCPRSSMPWRQTVLCARWRSFRAAAWIAWRCPIRHSASAPPSQPAPARVPVRLTASTSSTASVAAGSTTVTWAWRAAHSLFCCCCSHAVILARPSASSLASCAAVFRHAIIVILLLSHR